MVYLFNFVALIRDECAYCVLFAAESFFDKSLRTKLCDGIYLSISYFTLALFFDIGLMFGYVGTAALSYAEFQQTKQNYSMAKEIYQNVIDGASEHKESGNVYLGGGNMNVEGLMMGAMCALGQLESHLG